MTRFDTIQVMLQSIKTQERILEMKKRQYHRRWGDNEKSTPETRQMEALLADTKQICQNLMQQELDSLIKPPMAA